MRNEDLRGKTRPRFKKMGNKKIELVFHENKNNAGSINILTKRVGRGEKDTMEALIVG